LGFLQRALWDTSKPYHDGLVRTAVQRQLPEGYDRQRLIKSEAGLHLPGNLRRGDNHRQQLLHAAWNVRHFARDGAKRNAYQFVRWTRELQPEYARQQNLRLRQAHRERARGPGRGTRRIRLRRRTRRERRRQYP